MPPLCTCEPARVLRTLKPEALPCMPCHTAEPTAARCWTLCSAVRVAVAPSAALLWLHMPDAMLRLCMLATVLWLSMRAADPWLCKPSTALPLFAPAAMLWLCMLPPVRWLKAAREVLPEQGRPAAKEMPIPPCTAWHSAACGCKCKPRGSMQTAAAWRAVIGARAGVAGGG